VRHHWNTGTSESCGSLLGLVGRKSRRRSVATRARNPEREAWPWATPATHISARPRSISGPRVVFEKSPAMGRTRMGFSGATRFFEQIPALITGSHPMSALRNRKGDRLQSCLPGERVTRPECPSVRSNSNDPDKTGSAQTAPPPDARRGLRIARGDARTLWTHSMKPQPVRTSPERGLRGRAIEGSRRPRANVTMEPAESRNLFACCVCPAVGIPQPD
jgi:hypothetical protein